LEAAVGISLRYEASRLAGRVSLTLIQLAAVLVGTAGRSHGIDVRKDIVEFAEENVKRLREKCGVELPQYLAYRHPCHENILTIQQVALLCPQLLCS
jgi:hypothetical protein